EAFLRNAPQYIALIFGLIYPFGNYITAVFLPDFGIMPGGYKVTIQVIGPPEERVPFDMGVTQHTRVGCPALEVFTGEMVNHRITELRPYIQDIMRESEVYGYCPSIVDRIQAATACFFFG